MDQDVADAEGEALSASTSETVLLPSPTLELDPIIKIEKELEEDQMEEESGHELGDFKFNHFLVCDDQRIQSGIGESSEPRTGDDDGDYYNTTDIHIKEEVGEDCDLTEHEPRPFSNWNSTTVLGNYIKSEPQSDDEVQHQCQEESSRSTYYSEDNNTDSDWNNDCQEGGNSKPKKQRFSKRQKMKSRLASMNSSRDKIIPARRVVNPAESGRVLNAFQNIVENLCLSKTSQPRRRTKEALLTTGNKKEESLSSAITKANASARISDNRPQPITYPSHPTKTIQCAFCSEDFSPLCFTQHYRNYFHQFQCSSCLSTFCDRNSGSFHIQTSHSKQEVSVLTGNFFASTYCYRDPFSLTPEQEDCHWFKCSRCLTHLENEYLLIDHYRRVHQTTFRDTENFLDASSMGPYTAELNGTGMNLWSTKVKLTKCDVRIERIESGNFSNQLPVETSTASQNDVTRPGRLGRHSTKRWKPLIRSCGLCPKGFTTQRSYKQHMTNIHKVDISHVHKMSSSTQQITLLENASTNFDYVESISQPSAEISTSEALPNMSVVVVSSCFICNQQFSKSEDLIEHYGCHPELTTSLSSNDTNRYARDNLNPEESEVDMHPLMMVKAEHVSPDQKDLFDEQLLESEESKPLMNFQHIVMNIVPPLPRAAKYNNIDPLQQEDYICGECFQVFPTGIHLQRHVRNKHVTATDVSRRINASFSKIFVNRDMKKPSQT